jgi:hypothetical protein
MWKQQLERIPGAQLDPVVEYPLDQSMNSDTYSSQEAAISSENGERNMPHSSAVQITEMPSKSSKHCYC